MSAPIAPSERTGGESEVKIIPLTQMREGRTGVVAAVKGGYGMTSRLESLGILPGTRVTKVGSQPLRGPVMLRVNRTTLAVGFGMARRILVETEE